jgi:hypothetical protein
MAAETLLHCKVSRLLGDVVITVSWFSRNVVARLGHQPITPGGSPLASFNLQYSHFCSQPRLFRDTSARWQLSSPQICHFCPFDPMGYSTSQLASKGQTSNRRVTSKTACRIPLVVTSKAVAVPPASFSQSMIRCRWASWPRHTMHKFRPTYISDIPLTPSHMQGTHPLIANAMQKAVSTSVTFHRHISRRQRCSHAPSTLPQSRNSVDRSAREHMQSLTFASSFHITQTSHHFQATNSSIRTQIYTCKLQAYSNDRQVHYCPPG